ncbi:MAG: hypothetical protein E7626_04735 [Ruminococcaceae bacterium]|nr:hypothetical protein [Oscillospiraceae bacterium]
MKKILLTLLCTCILLAFVGCDLSTEAPLAEKNNQTNQTEDKNNTLDNNDEKELSPTPYVEINSFDEKMTSHFGSKKPTITQGRGSNVWIYNFGDFELEVGVNSYEQSPRTLSLELAETDFTNESFLTQAKEIFDILLGNITDEDFQAMMEYADGTYVLSDPGFTGKLSSITGVMYLERKMNSTETHYTIKCTYKEN